MSQTTNGGNNRIEYLDYLRGVLMALGVVTHAAYIYSVGGEWRISDPNAQSTVFNWVIDILHLFRLQSFFILSGFLFSLSAMRHGVNATFVKRVSRIAVPLIVVLLFINSIEVFVCEHIYRPSQGLSASPFWDFDQNSWIGHLWFLVYLLGFHCVALLIGVIRDKTRLIPATSDSLARYVVWVPLVAGVYDLAIRTGAKLLPILHARGLGLSMFDWLLFLPFYAVGVIAGTNRLVGAEMSKVRPVHFAMAAASGLIMFSNPFGGVANLIMSRFAHITLVWVCCIFCFYSFERLCRASGEALAYIRKLSAASYSIYLFHHLTVILLGLLLLNQNWPVWVKFSVVLTAATAFSYSLHLLISRVPVLLFLFNGVPLAETEKKRRTTAPEPVPQPVLQPRPAVLEPVTARSVAAAAGFGGGVTATYATSTPRASAARNGL